MPQQALLFVHHQFVINWAFNAKNKSMPSEDQHYMQLALDEACQGQGRVEPNPMVGCIIVAEDEIIGRGHHEFFGGPHAEINAIASVEQSNSHRINGGTAYVTLEPCSHTGKTGPCTEALINAGISRVVVACQDPNPLVAGKGIQLLRNAGIQVTTNVLAEPARAILAPYLKWTQKHKPWIIAKWAMTLDGKIATSTGDSQWISNSSSRELVHHIRGRVDGVMVGIGTAIADDPMLNARPPGCRNAARIVIDSKARLSPESQLALSAQSHKTIIAVGPEADSRNCERLKTAGCEVFHSKFESAEERLDDVLTHLAKLGMTNLLVEGGGKLLGSLHTRHEIDEVHIFIGPKIVGGAEALSPIEGLGISEMGSATELSNMSVEQIDNDIYVSGFVKRSPPDAS